MIEYMFDGSGSGRRFTTDAQDDDKSVAELIDVAGHCNRVIAAGQYRMLHVVARIHEQREDDYIADVAAYAETHPPAESGSVTEFLTPRMKYGLNGLERAIADVGAALCVTPQRARKLIAVASAGRYRVRETFLALGDGIIDLDRFITAVTRTDLVSPDAVQSLDKALADRLYHGGPMSTQRFQTLLDVLIATHDPAAVKRRKALVDSDRHITIRPDRFATGQARISGSMPSAKAAVINARLQAMAESVHKDDPRTVAQRRHDALAALAEGEQHLDCLCDTCTTDSAVVPGAAPSYSTQSKDAESASAPEGPAASSSYADPPVPNDTAPNGCDAVDDSPMVTKPSDDADTPAAGHATSLPSTCDHKPRAYMHVVVNLSTLLGHDDDPAYLDGQGVIDADTARSLVNDAKRAFITPPREDPAAAAERYRPSRKLRALIQAGELCCVAPGCNNPVSQADLDHQLAHAAGGRTASHNIGPLCRFHHRAKTFDGWQVHQTMWHTTVVTGPTGHSYTGNPYTGTDMFEALLVSPLARPPQDASRRRFDDLRELKLRKLEEDEKRWAAMNPPPF